jgi:class 3 adenylate cyclase/tetratricopeptide (TPR) repeat protein
MATWACTTCGGENPEGMRFCGHCGAAAASTSGSSTKVGEREIADALRSFVTGPVADKLAGAGGKLPEERRLITALFADVSGFTSLADRLDPEQLLEVIDPVISGLSSVVGRYGGYVEKFAGDALLALFGAPTAHEDDAARALRVALEMHEELARLMQELPYDAELTLHVGVNSGHGIARILGSEARMDYGVLGDSVILAQRLESSAPPRQTYVSEMTVRLTEAEFEFESVGELTLKGKAEPVPAWRLVAARTTRTPAVRAALIGREAELAVADSALATLASGHGSLLAITGEPGVGKSRLTEATFDHAATLEVRRLQARCVSYGSELPYWPYADLLRRTTGLRTDERPQETRARLHEALELSGAAEATPFFARLLGLPIDDEQVSNLEPEAFRRKLHEFFLMWVRALAREQPLLLVLEDMHWADASSLELTADLARIVHEAPVLFVLVGRPEARQQIVSAAGEIEPRWIQVGPFDRAGIGRLTAAILGGNPPEQLVAFIERRTSGNPFFVQELTRALRDSNALAQTDQGWTIQPGWDERQLPPTIEGVLTARLDLLPRETATTLLTAAVIGRRARVSLLDAVAGDPFLEDRLGELVRRGLLERTEDDGEPVVVFNHALLQDAAYSRLLRRRRREIHLQVAEVAEGLYGSGDHVIDLLARHLYLGGSAKAVDYLFRAGKRAQHLYANEEAILHFGRAAELAPDRHDVLLELASLHELLGAHEEAWRLYGTVRNATNDVRAWRGIAATLRKRGEYDEALAIIDEAFGSNELKGEDLTPLWLEAGWSHSVAGRFDQAIDVLQAGLEAADSARTSVVGQLLLQLSRAESVEGRLDAGLEHSLQAQQIFEQNEDLPGLAVAARVLGDTYRMLGRLDEGAAALRSGLELAERVGSVEEIGGCLLNLGMVELALERIDEAAAATRRAIDEFERIRHGSGRAQGHANLAWILTHAGRYDEAVVHAEQALQIGRLIGHPLVVADTLDTLATIALREGRFEAAAWRAEEAVALYLETGARPRAATTLGLAADAWERAGEEERARVTRERARSLSSA